MQIKAAFPTTLLDGHVKVGHWHVPKRTVFPFVLVLVALAGIFSPLFDLNAIHGIPTAKLYAQHLYFDGIGDAGGFYAATFCAHWYHKIPIAIGIALLSTLALVTLIG
jgi:hypothetical protein